MVKNAVGREIPDQIAAEYGAFAGQFARKPEYKAAAPLVAAQQPGDEKVLPNLREAIIKSGLKDGDTISFHHHFREGDYVMNLVMAEIDALGIKNLSLAPSSIANVHEPLIDYIKRGVVTNITSSGLRDKVGAAISQGIMDNPVVIRSHGGRARAIKEGTIHINVAFLGAPSVDPAGNINGTNGDAQTGSLGYAMTDAKYADKVIAITDNLVPFPNKPISIPSTEVDYIVQVDQIGDPSKISSGATRFTKNPKELIIAQHAAKVIQNSPYYKDGFSMQTGTGGAALAVSRFMADDMKAKNIKAAFAVGGITGAMAGLQDQGLIGTLFDVQDFDADGAGHLREHRADHIEIDAEMYASPFSKNSVINQLDIVILSALELDTQFNVNVMTGSDGAIRGASGGHSDTAASAKLAMIVSPLTRGRIPTIVDAVNTVITPGESIDVVVTEIGIAINPQRQDLIAAFKDVDIPQFTIEQLRDKAYAIVGKPEPIQYSDKVVAVIEYRDGSVIDVVNAPLPFEGADATTSDD